MRVRRRRDGADRTEPAAEPSGDGPAGRAPDRPPPGREGLPARAASSTPAEDELAEGQAIDWRFRVGDDVKIRLVNEMDSDHPMHHPVHIHGAGRPDPEP